MLKILSFGLMLILIAGCSTASSSGNAATLSDSLSGKRISVAVRDAAPFTLMSPDKGMETVLPGTKEAAEGREFRRQYGIDDPSTMIARQLGAALDRETDADIRYESAPIPVENIHGIVTRVKGEDFVLDVVTNGWGYHYSGFGSSQYFVGYSAQMRLIDSDAEKAVVTELCRYDPSEAGKLPVRLERLTIDNAARIKRDLADAAAYCADVFEARLLAE